MSAANETRWLDVQEQQVWAQLSTMILRLQPVLSAELQREFGISQFEYLIMARLSEAPESMLRMSVLATLTGSSLPRLSRPSAASKSGVGCHARLTRTTVGTRLRFSVRRDFAS